MYTLILCFLLIGGQPTVAHQISVTHVSGFRTEAACQAARVKVLKKFWSARGGPRDAMGAVTVQGLCVNLDPKPML